MSVTSVYHLRASLISLLECVFSENFPTPPPRSLSINTHRPQHNLMFLQQNEQMGRNRNWSTTLRHRFKTAVKKLNFILKYVTESKRRFSSICGSVASVSRRRSWSINDRYIGLQHCIEDRESDESSSVRALQRTTSTHASSSYSSDGGDDEIDKRAEIFISNFRRQLLYERQVSLQLRYGRRNSFH
ncbi:hypothetical protein Dsin_017870 [Dipteronia sinensis]|uniref:Uncharacterized protein n=1 Tax=Dipteronia sinensis TaxID=43782 RepID=A0AAE0AG40_9ROSI|nr:hypothetical protein Dsin_017870 [Dipteronia sinensis]